MLAFLDVYDRHILRGVDHSELAPCSRCGVSDHHRPDCSRMVLRSATLPRSTWVEDLRWEALCIYRVDGVDHYGFATAVSDDEELELYPDAGGEPVRVRLGECEYVDMVA